MTYSQLTSIPLFMGISGDDLAVIMDRVELLDIELMPGEVFVRSGDVCHCMAIVREGVIRRAREYQRGAFVNNRKQQTEIRYEVSEALMPGFILEPEILFGLEQRHQNTWVAETSCHLTLISKDDIRQTLMYVPVWRINFMNMLCTQLQRTREDVLMVKMPDEEARLCHFLRCHASENGKSMETDITLEQLGSCLGLERRNVSSVINSLEKHGVISKERHRILVPDLGNLRLFYSSITSSINTQ